jgi:hypothetical protein
VDVVAVVDDVRPPSPPDEQPATAKIAMATAT